MSKPYKRVCIVCGMPLFNRIKLAKYCDDCSDVLARVRQSLFSCVMHSKLLRPLNEKYVFSFRIELRKNGLVRNGNSGVWCDNASNSSSSRLDILPVLKVAAAGSNPAQTYKEREGFR